MLKDFMRRKEIIARAKQVATEIIKRYPPEMDQAAPGDGKAELKKKQKKLMKAMQLGKTDIKRAVSDLRPGVYGKAKFYKTIQDQMLKEGYTESSARIMIEELVRPF